VSKLIEKVAWSQCQSSSHYAFTTSNIFVSALQSEYRLAPYITPRGDEWRFDFEKTRPIAFAQTLTDSQPIVSIGVGAGFSSFVLPIFPYPTLISAKIWGRSFWNRSAMSGVYRKRTPRPTLISREIIFEVFQTVWPRYTSTLQTDGRADGQTICHGKIAPWVASRGAG